MPEEKHMIWPVWFTASIWFLPSLGHQRWLEMKKKNSGFKGGPGVNEVSFGAKVCQRWLVWSSTTSCVVLAVCFLVEKALLCTVFGLRTCQWASGTGPLECWVKACCWLLPSDHTSWKFTLSWMFQPVHLIWHEWYCDSDDFVKACLCRKHVLWAS